MFKAGDLKEPKIVPACWAMIKHFGTKQCGSELYRDDLMSASKRNESTLWQRRYWEHQIRNDDDYATHTDYLYFNPVKHGLVKHVTNWPHSTFHRYIHKGVYDKSWGGNDIESFDDEFGE